MKILYLVKEAKPDYQCDIVFHGLYKEHEVYDPVRMSQMYDDIPDKSKLYGRGFTLYGTLKDKNLDKTNIEDKIKNKFFDCVVYGSIHRCTNYFDLVSQVYDKSRIIIIDGEDRDYFATPFLGKGIYFKRELYKDIKDIFPIQFGFPKEKICSVIPIKEKHCATVLPGNKRTYIFSKEEDYYKDYQISKFAWTKKKGGWDCLRHYEIIANKCLPFFLDLEGCPKNIMTKWPKALNLKINDIYRNNSFTDLIYSELQSEMVVNLETYLTTDKIANYILSFLK